MGGRCSKNADVIRYSSSGSSSNSQVTPDLSSYEAACKSDPQLRSFDSTLQDRTSRVINSLAVGVEVRSLSLDSLREVTGSLLEMNQEVVKVILDCKKDIWKSEELSGLVEDYFENSLKTLDFCTVLGNCLRRARDSHLIVKLAVQQFEEEQKDGSQNYLKTLQQLKNFKAAGDPFSEQFLSSFQSVYSDQVSMLRKLQSKKRKLEKKMKSVKGWRKISNVIFAATFASVLICSVVAAAIAAPPVVTAVAAAAAVPLASMGKWLDTIWKKYEDELKGQKDMINSMQIGTYVVIKDLDGVHFLVEKLEIKMEGLLHGAEFALAEEGEALMIVVDEIKKELGDFAEMIDDLSEHAERCSRDVRRARTVIVQRIIKSSSS